MEKILFRCSELGNIMTEARSKSELLSETTKNYLIDLFIEKKYKRKKDIVNKYIEKGLMVEEDSITLYSKFKKQFYFKNKMSFSNDFIKGTPDIITNKNIIDIKSSWDIWTFFRSKKENINKMYYWQMQGYMELTGKEHARIVYCLVNTPQHLIDAEIRKLEYKNLDEETLINSKNAIEINSIFDDIPIAERVFEVNIEKNNDDIERLYKRIDECRKYIYELLNN